MRPIRLNCPYCGHPLYIVSVETDSPTVYHCCHHGWFWLNDEAGLREELHPPIRSTHLFRHSSLRYSWRGIMDRTKFEARRAQVAAVLKRSQRLSERAAAVRRLSADMRREYERSAAARRQVPRSHTSVVLPFRPRRDPAA